MSPTISLLWKEWREARAYLLIGLGVFLGLPFIGGVEDCIRSSRPLHIDATQWVLSLGVGLAVFAAVGATCRDVSGKIEDFWRSSPVTVRRWLSMKYLMGVLMVLIACAVPVTIEAALIRQSEVLQASLPFLWLITATYSIAFSAGCLLRRTAHAAMVGFAAALLIWLIPTVFPPMAWMNLDLNQGLSAGHWYLRQHVAFEAMMLGISAAGLLLAVLAVERGWRVESGRKMIYTSIACTVILLLASACFQLGTNLPILQKVDIPGSNGIHSVRVDGATGWFEQLATRKIRDPRTGRSSNSTVTELYKFHLSGAGITLLNSHRIDEDPRIFDPRLDATLPDNGYVNYFVGTDPDPPAQTPLHLETNRMDPSGARVEITISKVKLWDLNGESNLTATTYVWGKKLFVLGVRSPGFDVPHRGASGFVFVSRMAVLDISNPLQPALISNDEFNFRWINFAQYLFEQNESPNILQISLPALPGLPNKERLEVCLGKDFYGTESYLLHGENLLLSFRNSLVEYHLETINDRNATLKKLGEYQGNLLERFLGYRRHYASHQMQNGLLYEMTYSGSQYTQSYVSVFDTRGPHPMQMVGHFAAPNANSFCLLPDGRALVAGTDLWLVGPPR